MKWTLAENKTLRFTTLCALYVAQGIPWGFVTVTFAAWLTGEGVERAQLGPIIAVATLPWSFKFLWGPVVDRRLFAGLERRRPWIVIAQTAAILALSLLLLIEDPAQLIKPAADANRFWRSVYHVVPGPLAALILLANVFVSMQDVAVDALAVDVLRPDERGLANGLMYGSSYLGTAIGGAGLGWVVHRFGIQAGLLAQAGCLTAIMILPLLLRERPQSSEADVQLQPEDLRPQNEGIPEDSVPAEVDFGAAVPLPAADVDGSVLKNLLRAFSLRSTIIAAAIALIVKMGIGVLSVFLIPYLINDQGWTEDRYTALLGGWAMATGLSGAVIGGALADRIGVRPMAVCVSAALALLWVGVALTPAAMTSDRALTAMILIQEGLFGMLSATLFAFFMQVSWPKVAATQFTTYMALMNLSTTLGSYLAGWLGEDISFSQILITAGIVQLLVALPILLVDEHQTQRILGR
jgi:PAT family beta-lactamase induction signal transducer AmpG